MTRAGRRRSARVRPPAPGSSVRVWLLDTNALLLPFREHFPLQAELERIVPGASLRVPSSVLAELDRLRAEEVAGASAAREFARRFEDADAPGRGDDAILRLAVRLGAGVVTVDGAFQDRLTAAGVPVLRPRGRTHLTLRRPSGNR